MYIFHNLLLEQHVTLSISKFQPNVTWRMKSFTLSSSTSSIKFHSMINIHRFFAFIFFVRFFLRQNTATFLIFFFMDKSTTEITFTICQMDQKFSIWLFFKNTWTMPILGYQRYIQQLLIWTKIGIFKYNTPPIYFVGFQQFQSVH